MNAVTPPPAPYAFVASDCGGLRMSVRGTPVVMRCSGALWLEAERTLVVADLHLEKGSSYAARGQMLPPYDTRETLRRLEAEVAIPFMTGGARIGWRQTTPKSFVRWRQVADWSGLSATTTPTDRRRCRARWQTS